MTVPVAPVPVAPVPVAPAVPTLDPALAARIRFVGIDVDGVMTDGGIYTGEGDGSPLELKRYDIQDGLGVVFLRQAGILVGVLTGRTSESSRMRAEELRVDEFHMDPDAQKLPALRAMLDRRGVTLADTAFVGDDLPDLAVLRVVGLPVAVANATPDIRDAATLQLTRSGGHGAVREFAELVLRARGEWDALVERYVAERSGATSAVRTTP
jgi:3-deoxy-D-manno-octulosonate 8-phosphate phosphatase (KDO 8-P phosphatase)